MKVVFFKHALLCVALLSGLFLAILAVFSSLFAVSLLFSLVSSGLNGTLAKHDFEFETLFFVICIALFLPGLMSVIQYILYLMKCRKKYVKSYLIEIQTVLFAVYTYFVLATMF